MGAQWGKLIFISAGDKRLNRTNLPKLNAKQIHLLPQMFSSNADIQIYHVQIDLLLNSHLNKLDTVLTAV